MTRTIRGRVHGKSIQLDEDLGVPDGQEVEIQIKVAPPDAASMTPGLMKVCVILGERFDSGEDDVAARHNEHQPSESNGWSQVNALRNKLATSGRAFNGSTELIREDREK